MLAHLFALGRFLGAHSGFFGVSLPRLAGFGVSWRAPGSILEGSRWLQEGLWSFQGLIFRRFCGDALLRSRNVLNVAKE